jgi:cytochrome c-type biogenesis protein CcmF
MAQAANGSEVSVGPPYYNRMAVPIALLLLLLMAIGPAVRWSGDRFDRLLRVFAAPIAVGASIVVVLVLAGLQGWTALLAFGLAGVVATSVGIEYARGFQAARGRSPDGWLRTFGGWLVRDRHRNGGLLSHLGIAVVVVGITASSAYTTSSLRTLNLGEQVSVDGVTARLTNIHRSLTPGTISTAARLSIHGRGVDATALQPALRYFPAQSATVASPGIRSGLSGDVYTTLLSVNRQGTQATIRLAVNPMVGWIWFGGAVLACGGLIALWPGGRRRSTRRGVARAPVPETTGQQSDRELVAR